MIIFSCTYALHKTGIWKKIILWLYAYASNFLLEDAIEILCGLCECLALKRQEYGMGGEMWCLERVIFLDKKHGNDFDCTYKARNVLVLVAWEDE